MKRLKDMAAMICAYNTGRSRIEMNNILLGNNKHQTLQFQQFSGEKSIVINIEELSQKLYELSPLEWLFGFEISGSAQG